MAAKSLTFSKFTGDRETKTADILLDGVVIGIIEQSYAHDFVSRGGFQRAWRFEEVTVTGWDAYLGREHSFHRLDGFDGKSGVKAAKDAIRGWLA